MRNKVTTAAEAVAVLQTGDALCTSGFVGIGVPDGLLTALEKRFLETGEPRDLTLLFGAKQGHGWDVLIPGTLVDRVVVAEPHQRRPSRRFRSSARWPGREAARVDTHAAARRLTASSRMQRARRPGPSSIKGGGSRRQASTAKPQRGAKEQPAGAAAMSGGAPGIV